MIAARSIAADDDAPAVFRLNVLSRPRAVPLWHLLLRLTCARPSEAAQAADGECLVDRPWGGPFRMLHDAASHGARVWELGKRPVEVGEEVSQCFVVLLRFGRPKAT